MKYWKIGILVVIFFSIVKTVRSNEVKFEHLTVEHGLSQGIVFDVLQDHIGFMWFATNDGLNRYDGKNFHVYRNFKGSDGIFTNKISCLFYDRDNRLWVGTHGGGLFKYVLEKDTWINYVHDANDKTSISNNNISCILENEEGLWVGTYNNGLNLFDKSTGQFEFIPLYYDNKEKAHFIFSGLIDGNGNLWIGTDRSVIVYNTKNKTQYIPVFNDSERLDPGKRNVRSFYQDGSGKIWMGTGNGLFYYNPETKTIHRFVYPDGKKRSFIVRSIIEDEDKNLWIGFDGEGVGVYSLVNNEFTILKNNEDNPHSISNNSIYKIYQSRDGILWMCNYGSGINILDKKKNKFELYRHVRNDPKSLINNNVRCIHEDRSNNIWVGTRDGLELYNKETKTFEHFRPDHNGISGLSASIVLDIHEDSHGKFWIGTFAGGVNLMDRKSKTFKHYKSQDGPNALSDNNVYKIYEDSYNDLWIGTLEGLNKYNRVKDNFSLVSDLSGIKEIYEDSKGRLFIGSDRGLFIYHRKTSLTEKIWPVQSNIQIFYIAENSDREILVGTEGAGLIIFNNDLTIKQILSEENGLPNNNVYAFLEDADKNLWITTNKGLSRLSPDKKYMNFDVSDGLQGMEFNSGSCLKTSDGKFYFGGVNGLNSFYPENVKSNNYIPRIVITSLKINGYEAFISEESPLKDHIITTKSIVLKNYQSSITLEFSSLNYTNSHKNQYSYILEGLNETWSQTSTNNFVSFNKIPPGKYTFKVIGSNNDGIWNTSGTTLDIQISPPFWKTNIAIILYFIIVIIFLLLFKRYTLIGVTEKNNLKFEKLERSKQEKLNQMKLTFFTNISHEFRTPLTLILAPIQSLKNEYQNDPKLHEQLSLIQRNSKRLLNLVNQLMDFRRLERDKLYELKMSKLDIIPFLKDITQAFRQLTVEKNLNLNFFSEIDNCICWFSPDALDKIMYNLLSNAVKFTPENGEISVYVTRFALTPSRKYSFFSKKNQPPEFTEYIRILVKNTGKGISSGEINKLFDRFYQSESTGKISSEGSGIGLALTKSLVNLHLGNITVESQDNKGTCFHVEIPRISQPFEAKNTSIHFTPENDEPGILETGIRKYIWQSASLTSKAEDTETPGHDKKIILIVDDDYDMLMFLSSNFRNKYQVYTAKNGVEGLEIAIEKVPDIIIADVMMDQMDGIEMCKLIKQNVISSHIPVILLTAKTALEYKIEGYEVGADDYITKPFETELLEARIKNLLSTREKLKTKLSKKLSLEPSGSLVMSADEKFLNTLVSLIEKNLDNSDFDVDQVVDEIGMSRAVLYRKIKALTGLTVVDVVKDIRLKKAAILLESNKYSIFEVAAAVGFSDTKYFAKCFKKEFNLSPRDYMNRSK